ncbi:MAG: DUF4238 domain-containing protein [Nitrospira sp.]
MQYRKNHYVPESYLNAFAVVHPGDRNPMLWVYDKDGKAPRKQSPKNTAAINNLYKVSHSGVPPHALEEAFGKQESGVAPILSRWREHRVVPRIEEIHEVAYFLALLHLRNPKTAKWFEAMTEVMTVERAKALARDSAQFDKFWETLVAEGSPSSKLLTKEQIREQLLNFDEHFIVKFDQKYVTFSPMVHSDAIFTELKKMFWCLSTAPAGMHFITSDSPVVVRFKKGDGAGFGGGFGHPTAEVTFPISPTVCLWLSRHNRYKALPITSESVKNMNRRMAINSERYVFAHELRNGTESLVKKHSFTRQQPRLDKDEVIESIRARRKHSEHPSGE